MKAWKFKTHRHGETLIKARNFDGAVAAFKAFNKDYLRRCAIKPDPFRDEINSVECLGGIANK